MEHRQIFKNGEIPETRTENVERVNVLKNTTEAVRDFREAGIEMPALLEDVRLGMNDHELEARAHQRFATDLPRKLNEVVNAYGPRIHSIRAPLLQGLSVDDNMKDQMDEIVDAVTIPLPPNAAAKDMEHRYVRMTHEDDEEKNIPDWYGVDFRKIDADRAMLKTLSAAHPALRNELTLIDDALEDLSNQDERKALYLVEKQQANNRTDQTIMEMGKISIFLVAGLMAIGTGIMAWKTGKSMKGPLLLAAVSGLIASPTLRRRLFNSKDQSALAEIDGTLNNQNFKALLKRYDVAGPAWKKFTSGMMEDPAETKAFIKELARYENDPSPMSQQIDEYVEEAFPDSEKQERASLKKMIYDNRFRDFAQSILLVQEEQARQTILDYIDAGSARFEANTRAAANTTNRAARFPGGGTLGLGK